ncbi:unnamed protein product [Lactuca saligna]|uniref:Chromo domain-containing protein n=1 Tax=Lactuca saligna TaxID=75948 RepID=A0AA36EF71_LACSI|nr:unnamed protein product [Lactuca saligna]
MPPRKDVSSTSEDPPPTIADQLTQLIAATNAAALQHNNHLSTLIKATETLTAKFESQSQTTANLVNHITTLSDQLTIDDSIEHNRQPRHTPNQPPNNPPIVHPNNTIRPPKITLPLFDGSNPLDWIFQADNYFTFYQVPPTQRVTVTTFYFTGDALSWYKHLAQNDLLGSWTHFKRELELRFGSSSYENHEATLFKLQQTSTVSAYQTAFERLSNWPISLHQACSLAKLVEDKLGPTPKARPTTNFKHSWSTGPTSITTRPNVSPSFPPPSPTTPTSTKINPMLPFTRLSADALQERRKAGLCFKCPEKYVPGHKCSPPQFLIIVDNDDQDTMTDEATFTTIEEQSPPEFLSLSDAAFFGILSPQTLRITGHIANKPVKVLIDCGSTHNIVQPRVASLLNLDTQPVQPFSVMVGNGQHIQCQGFCPNVHLQLPHSRFQVPIFILPVEGADVILGITWLSTLGRLSADFSIPEITFMHDGKACTLTGESWSQHVSPNTLSSLLRQGTIASLHTLNYSPTPLKTTTKPLQDDHCNPIINSLLQRFPDIFLEPNSLPPPRPHDHTIPLTNPNTTVNVKPYRYYHRFVPFYAKIAAPLTNILKLKTFEWSTSAQEAFQQLKSTMQDLITLALPDFESQFDVTTDASGMAIGAVLSQNNRPISFFSKKLCTTMQNQSTYTKEIRVELPSIHAISHPTATWLDEIRKYFKYNEAGKQLVDQVIEDPTTFPHHSIRDGLVYRHNRIMVPPIPHLRNNLLQEFHASSLGGHSGENKTASIDSSLLEHQRIINDLKEAITKAQDRMVKQANKKRAEKEFEVDDLVYIRLQDYRHNSVRDQKTNKLARRFYGPYKITERIGKVAYRLALPANAHIHPIVHVSLLKQAYGSNSPSSQESPYKFEEVDNVATLPEAILHSRTDNKGNKEVLIKWENKPMEDATWESYHAIQKQFPFFTNIEDNVVSQNGGDVMNPRSQPPAAVDPPSPSLVTFILLHCSLSSTSPDHLNIGVADTPNNLRRFYLVEPSLQYR